MQARGSEALHREKEYSTCTGSARIAEFTVTEEVVGSGTRRNRKGAGKIQHFHPKIAIST